jgi:hypothetical protein
MTSALHHLLRVLRCASGLAESREPLEIPADSEPFWRQWTRLVFEHQLAPYLGSRPAMLEQHEVPEAIIRTLGASHLESARDAFFRNAELLRVMKRLEGRAPVIALKGAAVAHLLYDEIAARPMSDLDLLLVRSDQLALARVMLLADGYRSTGDDRPEHHHAAPIRDSVRELTIELHTNLTTPPLSEEIMAEIRERVVSVPEIRNLMILDPVARLFHHAVHAVGDPIDTPLVRNLLEVAMMVARTSSAQARELADLARRSGFGDRVSRALHLASELFGTPNLLAKEIEGPIERWSRARLDWTERRDRATRWGRFQRHLADHQIANRALLIAAGADGARRAAASRIESLRSRILGHIAPLPLATAPVGSGLLAHDPASGKVHFLSPLSALVWSAAEEEPHPQKIEAALLEAAGIAPESTRAAIDALWQSGLLVSRSAS